MGKAQRARELKKAFGPEIAESFDQLQQQVMAVGLQQRVLAKEFHERERDVAAVRQGREHDKRELGAKVDDLRERIDAIDLRLGGPMGLMKRLDRIEDIVLELAKNHNARLFALEDWARGRSYVGLMPKFRAADPAVEIIQDPTPAQREEFFQ